MDVLDPPAASSTYATDVFIIPEPRTKTTRLLGLHITGSTTTNLESFVS